MHYTASAPKETCNSYASLVYVNDNIINILGENFKSHSSPKILMNPNAYPPCNYSSSIQVGPSKFRCNRFKDRALTLV